MSTKQKPKRTKKYRPKLSLPGGGLNAIARIGVRGENASPLADDQITDISGSYWLSLANMKQGTGSMESCAFVGQALNLAMVLAEQGIGREHLDDIVVGLDAVAKANFRGLHRGSYRLDGPGMHAVSFAMEVHDEQLRVAHRKEIVQAIAEVNARIDSGNVYTIEKKAA